MTDIVEVAHLKSTTPFEGSFKLLFSGDEYFLRLLEEIKNARTSIWVEIYIFSMDEIGRHIFAALTAAHQRGVEVKILMDGVGSSAAVPFIQDLAKISKIQTRVYHPLPFLSKSMLPLSWVNSPRHQFKKPRFPFRWNRGLYLFRRINKRDHRKVVLIDDRLVFIGSCNIADVHSERLRGASAWRDTVCEIHLDRDPVLQDSLNLLKSAFMQSWNSSRIFSRSHFRSFLKRENRLVMAGLRKQTLNRHIEGRFRLNNTPFLRFFLLRDLNRRIKSAQEFIRITNAYFLPRKSLLRALIAAQTRGVQVELLLPEKTDVWIVREAARSLYSRL